MTTELSTMMAPTDRSIPAVRITSDCAQATMPTIPTCCRISVSAKGEKNLLPNSSPNTITDSTSTISGTSDGVTCRRCWNFWMKL